MPRPTWKGHISFGLVHIPVSLYTADQRTDISFHMLDSRNSARVRYERVNEHTGEEVPWDSIVKGYEFSDGNYIVLSEEELERAAPAMTKRIEIEQFVELGEINVVMFDRPYVLVPEKGGEKGYALLRDAMAATRKVGIAQVVIRSRGYLAALMPQGDALVLELLRYQQEIRDLSDFALPSKNDRQLKVNKKEQELAEQLIAGMTGKWNPAAFHDEYRDALMKLIERRIKTGDTVEGAEPAEEADEEPRTVNFMEMLKQSVRKTAAKSRPATKRATAKRTPSKPRKKKAG
jgi:DNA end-binding protein Ku